MMPMPLMPMLLITCMLFPKGLQLKFCGPTVSLIVRELLLTIVLICHS
jgi:hypothetical protein